ncbi:hypothetical protein H7E67_15340 [Clostridium gasigenes]|uniref:three component ABC system middle component n=1 Tax=Clostridium gasigenes TaxID=94869 RepID=UPI001623AA45|nr:three component ABC system middle component [Clostridium gasigenes]MBB6624814.1 hypothetical protein [Clostridium gasigenes]
MKNWDKRAKEIAYLLNPAFSGRIIYQVIRSYSEETKRPMPFPLIYIILPLVLHKKTRERIKSITQMQVWIKRNQELLIGFADRTRDLVEITNETIEYLMQSGIVTLNNNAELEIAEAFKYLSKTKYTNEEIKECINKSISVAKWFAKAGTVETIYTSWGIRP